MSTPYFRVIAGPSGPLSDCTQPTKKNQLKPVAIRPFGKEFEFVSAKLFAVWNPDVLDLDGSSKEFFAWISKPINGFAKACPGLLEVC